jgi:hypothetical protein
MKLSGAQQSAMDAMRAADGGKIVASQGVKRTTVEALERLGLVLVTRTLGQRDVHHRDGRITHKTTVQWSAQLRPDLPTEDVLAELDEVADGVRPMQPHHREPLAAYVATSAPRVALPDAPAKLADYSPAAAYARHLRDHPVQLVGLYRMYRHLTGDRPQAVPEGPDIGDVTNFWVITEPGTPAQPGKELCRVTGETHNAACLAANSLLNRRGGYAARRLGDKELGLWRYDFRAGGRVLRLSAVGDGREEVTEVATGRTVVVRGSVTAAERDARAEVDSLTSALNQT